MRPNPTIAICMLTRLPCFPTVTVTTMNELERDLAGALGAHRTLGAHVGGLTDEQATRPSLLPGWTVAHVLTHIARNADGLANMLEGAARGEVAEMYPGGFERRVADIEAGVDRTARAIVDDIDTSSGRLESAFAAMTHSTWNAEGITVLGPVRMADIPFRRWRETEVHHADAGLGYSWRDWPSDYVRLELQRMTMLWNSRQSMGLTGLPAAALAVDEHHRVAWLLGRATIDGLEPAGLMA
jgi:maleylpyruvate isomerase